MPRPIHATIHTAHLAHNLQVLKNKAPNSRLWATIKANAYGHGIRHVYEALRAADGFAVLDLDEAALLRELGWRGPILLIEGAFDLRDLELCSRLNLWHVVHTREQIDMLAAHKTHTPQRVFLKLNSGMNRLGFEPAAFRSAYARLAALPQVDEITLMTHFSDADGPRLGQDGIDHQLAVFAAATQDLAGEKTLANSAAILRYAEQGESCVAQDWVRAGIALYGSAPDYPQHASADWGLRPAMSLSSQLISVRDIAAGQTVGYGSTFCAEQPMRIGIVACGYADGYPRHAPTGTPVLVQGQRSRTLGRISMDMLAVDLSAIPQAGFGSPVTLWGAFEGEDGEQAVLPIDEVARAADTLGYELMCALAARVPCSAV